MRQKIKSWWFWQQTVMAYPFSDETLHYARARIKDNYVIMYGVRWKIWYRDERKKYLYLYRF